MNDELKSTWTLRNIDETHADWDETFRIPLRQDRENLRPTDTVQLHFIALGQPQIERVWVEILDVQERRYQGEILNRPFPIAGLEAGIVINFGPEHVGRILIRPGHPFWCDCYEKRVIISARALEPGKGASFAYREASSHDDDSGWRLTEGTEDEAYMEDFANARLVVAGVLIERDASLAAVFRGEFGDDCRRNGIDEHWYTCE